MNEFENGIYINLYHIQILHLNLPRFNESQQLRFKKTCKNIVFWCTLMLNILAHKNSCLQVRFIHCSANNCTFAFRDSDSVCTLSESLGKFKEISPTGVYVFIYGVNVWQVEIFYIYMFVCKEGSLFRFLRAG